MKLIVRIWEVLSQVAFAIATMAVMTVIVAVLTALTLDAFIYESTGSCQGCIVLTNYFEWREGK